MVRSLVWRPQALEDIDSLLEYIAQENPFAAQRYVNDIRDAGKRLIDFPESGRVFDGPYRILVVRRHLLIYRLTGANRDVLIVNVLDSRRDPDAVLLELGEDSH